jgi:hypothetical protein
MVCWCRLGLLKSRWRILKLIPVQQPDRISELIVSLLYLHNFCENEKDGWEPAADDDEEAAEDADNGDEAAEDAENGDELIAGRARRQQIVDHVAALLP